ncbi:Uma2 family endonuclease [Venenivibrio stagnispumantis]|uniref:Endonuclease, Uma2 family (Restriction endonuclease fold) n=1 Tax=Venenivibrio stagnispumantis TaxID=407998 RepID=A0AA45WM55_9AQUI|nr:Uma2 family endonuclease [Venenivibrio stagnispumantis]MCW4572885.1 Uma2 family endonuclease [Venenivibrio stagnispumantis]SMP12879.1 Endonuclease, Uma2 family (restriction endonuclease fold) [Venenivibrio stagnispumantis]
MPLLSEKNIKLKIYKFTIAQLQKMYEFGLIKPDNKIELIDGKPIMMTPIGFRHAKVLERLEKKLYEIIYLKNEKYIIWSQNPIKKSNKELLYPDIAIYPESIYQKEDIPHISDAYLIIEISDTTIEYDKQIKLPIYAKGKAKEVWIVNLKENIIEKYTNPAGKFFKEIHIFKKDEKISIFNSEINLADIF